MSDYLWDKSGEPDPTIERLENLLAAKRYENEPLRLPPAAPLSAPRAIRPHRLYPQVAALAAGIMLAIIVGVWMHERHKSVGIENASIGANNSRREALEESRKSSLPAAGAPVDEVERRADKEAVGVEEKPVQRRTIEPRGTIKRDVRAPGQPTDEQLRVARVARRSRSFQTGYGKHIVVAHDVGETEVLARLHDERARAKEQLMLAMRMTSAKLNVARDKTQAAHAAQTVN